MNTENIGLEKMKGKDLITVGIFTAIYFAVNMMFMIIGGMHPVLWILMPAFIAVFAGVPYMILVAKVQKMGAIMLMGFITGIIYFASGTFTVVILIAYFVACLLAEIVRYITKYKSFLGNVLSYMTFSIGMIGSPLPIWLFKEDFLAQIKEQGMSVDYVEVLEKVATTNMLVMMIVFTIVFAFAGAMIAKKMMKKHFEKAGIV